MATFRLVLLVLLATVWDLATPPALRSAEGSDQIGETASRPRLHRAERQVRERTASMRAQHQRHAAMRTSLHRAARQASSPAQPVRKLPAGLRDDPTSPEH